MLLQLIQFVYVLSLGSIAFLLLNSICPWEEPRSRTHLKKSFHLVVLPCYVTAGMRTLLVENFEHTHHLNSQKCPAGVQALRFATIWTYSRSANFTLRSHLAKLG